MVKSQLIDERSMPFEIVNSLQPDQIDDLMVLYRDTAWASERVREDVERMLLGTNFIFGAVRVETGRLCAFARVLTDGVYRAVLFDVIVHPDFRGYGLARMILDAVCSHPVLGEVENLILYCKSDVVGLYESWGFIDQLGENHLMFRGEQR